jgi:chromosomal replication initiator protein
VSTGDKDIVSVLQRAVADRVGEERYRIWFGRGVRMELFGTTLRIAAADSFRLDFLRRAFRDVLAAAATQTLGVGPKVEFVVDPGLLDSQANAASGDSPRAAAAATATHLARWRSAIGELPLGRHAGPTSPPAEKEAPLGSRYADVSEEPSRQAAPDGASAGLVRRQFASLHEYVACEANRLAVTAALTAAQQPGTYTPLTFIGPPGSGKTHLLEGIWRQVRDTRALARVMYLSAEQFTNQFLDALRQSGTPSFRRKIRDVQMLLIDDVQFFGGKQSTLIEVVHTIETFLRAGRQLVFSADRPLAELRGLGPEVVARLSGGLVCPLQPADYAARLEILRRGAAQRALQVPDEVLCWLAGQLPGDGRMLAGALNRLQAASFAHQRPIDLAFAQSALDDLLHASRRPVRLPEIVEAVCDLFGVAKEALQSNSKSSDVTTPRMLAMFLARKWTRAAHSEISRALGRKSHSTVVSAQQKVEKWLSSRQTVRLRHGPCPIDDAIRRIESQLRVG